ncbi:MAG: phosphatidylserine decarboxylase [Acidobacteriota bacterium]
MKIDAAAAPFVAIAALPAVAAFLAGSTAAGAFLLVIPIAITLFFRDPARVIAGTTASVLSPADGTVMYAGPARAAEAPAGKWQQVTIFLSLFDVHINRTPVAGRVMRVDYVPGTFHAAFKPDAHANERSEIWLDHDGVIVVTRQVVGVLARRVVCRVRAGDRLEAGQRIGVMKFGSRMDVFVPMSASVHARVGDKVVAGQTIIATLMEDRA